MSGKRKRARKELAAEAARADSATARPAASSSAATSGPAWWTAFLPLVLVLVGLAAYANTFKGEFVFDDQDSILQNPSILSLKPLWKPLFPPRDTTVAGRPIPNFTLAVNYAIHGFNVWGYHAFNIAVHLAAACLLYGVVRRTLLLPPTRDRYARSAPWLALAVSSIWTLHTLQTESVTYMIQRVESVMGLFYLLTLYAFIRSLDAPRGWAWGGLAVAACALGMGSKEVMATAPVVILLFDRIFVAPNWRETLRARWGFHAGLAAGWIVLALMLIGKPRTQTAGFGFAGLPWHAYLRNQFPIVLHYLKLAFWPTNLVLDYGWTPAQRWGEVLPAVMGIAALLGLTALALRILPRVGFLAAAIFVILAPTSTVYPITELCAEHRMYLPLAPLAALCVVAVWRAMEFAVEGRTTRHAAAATLGLVACAALGAGTHLRNRDYKDAATIFGDAVAKRPDNPRAHNNYGAALSQKGDLAAAKREFDRAIEIDSGYAQGIYNLGALSSQMGDDLAARDCYEMALMHDPKNADAQNNLGAYYAKVGKTDLAMKHLTEAITLKPNSPSAQNNMGALLSRMGRHAEAVERFKQALALKPDYPEASNNLGKALAGLGRMGEARAAVNEALRLKPDYAEAKANLASFLANEGKVDEAAQVLRDVISRTPDNAMVRVNYGLLLARKGETEKAGEQFLEAIKLEPRNAEALNTYGTFLAVQGRVADAMARFEEAVKFDPNNDEARRNLAKAKAQLSAPSGAAPSAPPTLIDPLVKSR